MKTYEIAEDKFTFLVNKLAILEVMLDREAVFLGMTESERTESVFNTMKEIANHEFYRSLGQVK